jgi:hypothetical protein
MQTWDSPRSPSSHIHPSFLIPQSRAFSSFSIPGFLPSPLSTLSIRLIFSLFVSLSLLSREFPQGIQVWISISSFSSGSLGQSSSILIFHPNRSRFRGSTSPSSSFICQPHPRIHDGSPSFSSFSFFSLRMSKDFGFLPLSLFPKPDSHSRIVTQASGYLVFTSFCSHLPLFLPSFFFSGFAFFSLSCMNLRFFSSLSTHFPSVTFGYPFV